MHCWTSQKWHPCIRADDLSENFWRSTDFRANSIAIRRLDGYNNVYRFCSSPIVLCGAANDSNDPIIWRPPAVRSVERKLACQPLEACDFAIIIFSLR